MTNEEKEIFKKELNEKLDLRLDFAKAFGKLDFLAECDLGSETRNETIVNLRSQLLNIKDQVNYLLTMNNSQ
tara:strand:- start:242 stop:457 length:216 start_codon:yes stop_codon:yes gene_type:complete